MRIALITGASSGMGREYARRADASREYDQLWIVARRRSRLEELAGELETESKIIEADLGKRESIDMIDGMLRDAESKDTSFEVGLLVNTAGFGKFGTYADMTLDEVDSMIDVNCRALVDITQIVLPHMHKGGHILQFASSAGFQPLQGLNVYAATKSFVIFYTRALRRELHGQGIYVTAVCPLWIKTEFIEVARRTSNGMTVKHPWPIISPKRVAKWSMFINKINYPVATCSVFAFLMRVAGKIIPSPIIDWIWEGLRRI